MCVQIGIHCPSDGDDHCDSENGIYINSKMQHYGKQLKLNALMRYIIYIILLHQSALALQARMLNDVANISLLCFKFYKPEYMNIVNGIS